jgi:transcriptional regulator with XRE-family HTH domain
MRPSDAYPINLRGTRERLGLTQAFVASGIGMDRPSYGKLEKGDRKATVNDLVATAAVLDVPVVPLLLPGNGAVELTRSGVPTVDASTAYQWATGAQPLDLAHADSYFDQPDPSTGSPVTATTTHLLALVGELNQAANDRDLTGMDDALGAIEAIVQAQRATLRVARSALDDYPPLDSLEAFQQRLREPLPPRDPTQQLPSSASDRVPTDVPGEH